MFEFSFAEIALIGLVAFLVLGPEDFIAVSRKIGNFIRKVKAEFAEISDALKETGDTKTNLIRGDDGKLYPAYDLTDITPAIRPSPNDTSHEPPGRS